MFLTGRKGQQYQLPSKELTEGGEGAIYRLSNGLIVKKYHQSVLNENCELEQKLVYMMDHPPSRFIEYLAWPIDVLYENGRFCGFVMRELKGYHELKNLNEYSPALSKPLDLRLMAAKNLTKMVWAMHDAGYVIGDMNPKNIGYSDEGFVCLYDIDSFQVNTGNRLFRCGVLVPGYVAPEIFDEYDLMKRQYLMAGKDVKTLKVSSLNRGFSKETDNFALAVHIFQLMMNGFSPYSSIDKAKAQSNSIEKREYKSSSTAIPDSDDNVKMDRYCFNLGLQPFNAATPDKDGFPSYMMDGFKRAFRHIDQYSKRPDAKEWDWVLEKYLNEIKRCKNNNDHYYWNQNYNCPYCDADQRYRERQKQFKKTFGISGNLNAYGTYIPSYKPLYEQHLRMRKYYGNLVDKYQLNEIIDIDRGIVTILENKTLNNEDRMIYNKARDELKDIEQMMSNISIIVHLPDNNLENNNEKICVSSVNMTGSNERSYDFGEVINLGFRVGDDNGHISCNPREFMDCAYKIDYCAITYGYEKKYKYSCLIPIQFGIEINELKYDLSKISSYKHVFEYDLVYTNERTEKFTRWKYVPHSVSNKTRNEQAKPTKVSLMEKIDDNVLKNLWIACFITTIVLILIMTIISINLNWFPAPILILGAGVWLLGRMYQERNSDTSLSTIFVGIGTATWVILTFLMNQLWPIAVFMFILLVIKITYYVLYKSYNEKKDKLSSIGLNY